MRFRRSGRAAAAVASRPSADEYHDVAAYGAFAAHVFRGSGGDHRADLHSLCGVAVVVYLTDLTRGESDLISV